MLLSIVINAWPGTDKYRFRLQLETLTHDTIDVNNYFLMCKDLLNGWDRNKFEIPSDNFKSTFKQYNFTVANFDSDDVEMILAMDSYDENEIEPIFKSWCDEYNIKNVQVVKSKLGLSGMRNLAMQVFKGKFLIFRDDDDFSASIGKLLNQCRSLNFMGNKDWSYQANIPSYKIITERWKYFQQYQKKPTIAIMMDGMKLKNTWGSLDNPFSATPTPVDTSKLELVDRSPFISMCTKIFTREAVKLIYNTTCCTGLEDGRSFYLQQLPQHCIWLFEEKQLKWLREQWDEFKRTNKFNAGVKWLNVNIVTYREWQIKDKESIDRVDNFFKHNFYISKCRPSFTYVLASGNYSRVNWTYGSIIGTLEAFRNSNRNLDFTIADLKKLKQVITAGIKTTLINTNNTSKVEWINSECKKEGEELARLLTPITNYKYIFWFAVVHNNEWNMFSSNMMKIKQLLPKINVKPVSGTDIIKDEINHPNSIVLAKVNDKDKELSISNVRKIKNISDDTNYTERFEIVTMIGGENKSSNPLIYILFIIVVVIFVIEIIILNHREHARWKRSMGKYRQDDSIL